jgi:esterase/lipase superfamily enzyme
MNAKVVAGVPRGGEFKEHAVIFIHGYNMSFDDGLYRTKELDARVPPPR